MSELPLTYKAIKRELLAKLGSEYPPGSRLPPGAKLARKLGFGQRNTQRALAELTREGYLMSRPRCGTVVSAEIKRLLARRDADAPLTGKRIAIVSAGGDEHPLSRALIKATIRPLRRVGAVTTVVRGRFHKRYDLKNLPDGPWDGVVLINPDSMTPLAANRPEHLVVISTASAVRVAEDANVNIVTVRDEAGGRLAGLALRKAGCRSACFVGVRDTVDPGTYDNVSAMRRRGFEAGWGQALPEKHLLSVTAYGDTSGARAACDYMRLKSRPEAVFAASDDLAYGFMLALIGHGLWARRDYRLIGFDGQFLSLTHTHGTLFDSVAAPLRELGRSAAQILTRHVTHPNSPAQRVELSCSLKLAADSELPALAAALQ